MRLYLIQHGLALPEAQDPQKSLSPEGKEQTQKMAEFLRTKNIKVDYLWHSPKMRAKQTAQIISESILCPGVQERDDLNPLDPVSQFPVKIQSLNKDLMIVGHLPFLATLASLLLTQSEENQPVSFINSGVVCLEYTENWKVLWMVTPDLV